MNKQYLEDIFNQLGYYIENEYFSCTCGLFNETI